MIFDPQVRHGVASRRQVVLVTWPMRFHANLAVVRFVGLAGCFEISTPTVKRDGLPLGWADAAGGRTNAAAATSRAAGRTGMRKREPGKRKSTTGGSENSSSRIGF